MVYAIVLGLLGRITTTIFLMTKTNKKITKETDKKQTKEKTYI